MNAFQISIVSLTAVISQLTHVVLFCFVLKNLTPGTQNSDANNSLPRIPADA